MSARSIRRPVKGLLFSRLASALGGEKPLRANSLQIFGRMDQNSILIKKPAQVAPSIL